MLKVAGFIEQSNGTVTTINTGTGLTGGPITTSGTISLANTTVAAGTYGNSTAVAQIAVDAQGRITSASNVTISLTAGGNTTEMQYNNGGVLAGLPTFTTDGTNLVLSTNSATNALRITQTGAGNALLVEDEANPDASPFIVDANGNVQIGTTTSSGKLSVYSATNATVAVQSDATTNIFAQRSSTDTANAALILRKSRGTVSVPTAVATGDNIGTFNFVAYGGTSFRTLSQMQATVEAYVSDTDIASSLRFLTSPVGSAAGTEKMRITAAGNVGIGISAPLNKLDVTGSFGRGAPVTKTGNFTLADTENWVICNGTGSITVTFPAASSWTGREVMIKTIAAQTVVSASSNVVPINSAAAGTAILPATAGSWATLVSDGTNWIIMAS